LEDGKGKFQGASGCNAMLGQYESDEYNLTIDTKHIAMTLMACPEIKIETQFINVLGLVKHWKIINNNLALLDSNGTVLTRFEAVKK
jgi:heat shock protein HslJ